MLHFDAVGQCVLIGWRAHLGGRTLYFFFCFLCILSILSLSLIDRLKKFKHLNILQHLESLKCSKCKKNTCGLSRKYLEAYGGSVRDLMEAHHRKGDHRPYGGQDLLVCPVQNGRPHFGDHDGGARGQGPHVPPGGGQVPAVPGGRPRG